MTQLRNPNLANMAGSVVLSVFFLLLPTSNTIFTRILNHTYGIDDDYVVSDVFPSCVDVIDVWPLPNTVLKPIASYDSYEVYAIRITYSRPVIPRNSYTPYFTLSVSTITPLMFLPYYYRYSYGSGRSLWAYFRVPYSMQYLHKVTLIIDGGMASREVPRNYDGVTRILPSLLSTTTIVAHYYFDNFLRSHSWFQPPGPLRFPSSPYCVTGKKRKLHFPELLASNLRLFEESENVTIHNSAQVHFSGHFFKSKDNFKASELLKVAKIRISAPLERNRNERSYSLHLPRVINATLSHYKVSVELPNWNISLRLTGRQDYMYKIPVSRELIYELKERIYHNQFKIMYPANVPSYFGDYYGVYFPIFETQQYNISVKELYTKRELDYYFKVINDQWAHISRSADIRSPIDPVPVQSDNFQVCSMNSKRNLGRQGLFINNVIEYGSFYHRLIPKSVQKWSKEKLNPHIIAKAQVGGKTLELHPVHDTINIPASIKQALSKYVCIIPALEDITGSPGWTKYKFYHLDKCIFVTKSVAESQKCGGLQLFRNLSFITKNHNFCEKSLGNCIGAPFPRFPSIPTYGLQEITGFHECEKLYCGSTAKGYSSLMNTLYPNASGTIIIPRSNIKLIGKSDGVNTTAILQLIPDSSREHLYLSVTDVTILKPIMPQTCSEVMIKLHQIESSQFGLLQTRAVLSMLLRNSGKGGGNVKFGLKCSNHIRIIPSLATLKSWIEPEGEISTSFILDTFPAIHHERRFHKCQLTMALVHPLQNWELSCPYYFPTYYGRLKNPCDIEVKMPLFDMVYYVLPKYKSKSIHSLALFLRSPVGSQLNFIRAITISLEIPTSEVEHIWIIREVKVQCTGSNIVVLSEDQLLLKASSVKDQPVIPLRSDKFSYTTDFTRSRKVFFFSSRQDIQIKDVVGLCFVRAIINQPNTVCVKSRVVIRTLFIPLGSNDLNAIVVKTDGRLHLISNVYGKQSLELIMFLGICFVFSIICCCSTFGGVGYKLTVLKKLPTQRKLYEILKEYNQAKKKDKLYWGNPQVYVTSATEAAPHDVHFNLYDFKTNKLQPLDDDLKSMNVMGELRYETKKMPIAFGHIKKIFADRGSIQSSIWLVASSGVYLLKYENVAPEYKQIHYDFLERVHSSI